MMAEAEKKNPRLIRTLRDDITSGGFFANLKREAREIEDFYLNEEERDQLMKKGKVWRWFVLGWWVLKNSILRLSSLRRLLLVAGILLTCADLQSDDGGVAVQYRVIGAVCLLLVIILELKDKLLARSELESGRAVQRAMAPEATPFVPGWNVWLYTRPANEVGGDLVDFLKLDGMRCGIAIGDVAGKGLGAALFMVKLQSTLRALAPDFESLTGLAAKLNAILIRDGIPGRFASLAYVRVDPSSNALNLVNAGHMPPLIVSAGSVTELPKGSPALGLSPDTRFSAHDVTLGPGESLVIYSDGLTDAMNEAGEFYGLERLTSLCLDCRSIPAQSFGERVLASVEAFEGQAPRTDDLSLVILQNAQIRT